MASGGGCKPIKSWGYLLGHSWDEYGHWHCESLVEGYQLKVPMLDGEEGIELCHASKGTETLGVFTAPDGNSQDHLAKITDKVQTWIARIKNGHLPVSFNWTSYIFQLWTGVHYGIGALPADQDELDGFLQESYRDMLPNLGVNRNIMRGWCTLHRSFLGIGIGLFDFDVEIMIQRVNLFMQHYDSPYDIGITLRATMELVQLKQGSMTVLSITHFLPMGIMSPTAGSVPSGEPWTDLNSDSFWTILQSLCHVNEITFLLTFTECLVLTMSFKSLIHGTDAE
jgi:hypothetical protein